MGRSSRTVDWYQQKMDWYRRSGGVENLEQLNAFELKQFLAEQKERGLSDNTNHFHLQQPISEQRSHRMQAAQGLDTDPHIDQCSSRSTGDALEARLWADDQDRVAAPPEEA
jgi:hypothetical protein